jgi:Protein of unknown function (DUF4058)
MSSPFMGMDAYLASDLWPSIYYALADKIRLQLTPYLKPRYEARLAVHIVENDESESESGLLYPDTEPKTPEGASQPEPALDEAGALWVDVTPPVTIPLSSPQVRLARVEIRIMPQEHLVTRIEILSPFDKRGPGLTAYRQKRHRMRLAGIHSLEIDLLRQGTRTLAHSSVPDAPYLITLIRAHANTAELWPIRQEHLPIVPVPLRAPDLDVPLDLSAALTALSDDPVLGLQVDLRQPPSPAPLSDEELAWQKSQPADSDSASD